MFSLTVDGKTFPFLIEVTEEGIFCWSKLFEIDFFSPTIEECKKQAMCELLTLISYLTQEEIASLDSTSSTTNNS